MNAFQITALHILPKCEKSFRKILSEEYYLLNDRCIIDEEKVKLNPNHVEFEYYAKNITIQAIVGKNGSGKSSLLEMMYRIINNFSCLWVKDFKRAASSRILFIEGLYAELYYVIDGELLCLSCEGDNVVLKKSDEVILFLSRQYNTITYPSRRNTQAELSKYCPDLFYSIITNYSIQSLIPIDFSENSTDISTLSERYFDNGNWLANLFSKNDGYLAPIVISPFRDKKGIIDVNTERQITISRLSSILLLYKNKNFIPNYRLSSILYSFDFEKVIEKIIPRYASGDSIIEEDYRHKAYNFAGIVMDNRNCIAFNILEEFGYIQLLSIKSDVVLASCMYLVYKVINIVHKYPSYIAFSDIIKDDNWEGTMDKGKLWRHKELIKKIKRDNSHITVKLKQVCFFLDAIKFHEIPDDFSLINFDYYSYSKIVGKNASKNNLFGIMTTLPPPFFTADIRFDEYNNDGNIIATSVPLSKMSSGERQYLYTFSTFIYHIKNLLSISDPERVHYRKINLVMDEVEICLHPEYQRLFISNLTSSIKRLRLNGHCTFNIIIATHSPFILSDIPQQNILYLKDGKKANDTITTNPFGANINDVLKQSFFLEKGFVGEFAQGLINTLVDFLDNDSYRQIWSKEKAESFIDSFIGEGIIKFYLKRLFDSKYEKDINR